MQNEVLFIQWVFTRKTVANLMSMTTSALIVVNYSRVQFLTKSLLLWFKCEPLKPQIVFVMLCWLSFNRFKCTKFCQNQLLQFMLGKGEKIQSGQTQWLYTTLIVQIANKVLYVYSKQFTIYRNSVFRQNIFLSIYRNWKCI